MSNITLDPQTKKFIRRKMEVISHPGDFGSLFMGGFNKLRAITYVASPEKILEFFTKYNYTEVEILVGENLTKVYMNDLKKRRMEVIQQLSERVGNGTLRILLPQRTVHTKLYILDGPKCIRVILTSANLSDTAWQGTKQMNSAWHWDFPPNDNDSFLNEIVEHYQEHVELSGCSLFMNDLLELFKDQPNIPREDLIHIWLKEETSNKPDLEEGKILNEIVSKTLNSDARGVFTIQPPKTTQGKRAIKPFVSSITEKEVQIKPSSIINYFQKEISLPLMRVDMEKSEVILGFNGSIHIRTASLPESNLVNKSLENFEKYFQGVDMAETTDPNKAKMNMLEASLSVFAAPWAYVYKDSRVRSFGVTTEQHKPLFPVIYGRSHNGKSVLLQFILGLMIGVPGTEIIPLSGKCFTRETIEGIKVRGSVFPVIFDEITARQIKAQELRLKNYWGAGWVANQPLPQIIMTTNNMNLPPALKSRIRLLTFDAYFLGGDQEKAFLHQSIKQDNQIFTWFSYLYFKSLQEEQVPSNDELHIARSAFEQLYNHAGRPLPAFFPDRPVDEKYDSGREEWLSILYIYKQARIYEKNTQLQIPFELPVNEVRTYESYLPQRVSCKRSGSMIIIKNPATFREWLKSGNTNRNNPWFKQLLHLR